MKRDSNLLERIASGRTDLVFEHVSAGGSPSETGADGVSLLQWCAYFGDVSAIRFLVGRGASLASLGENLDLAGAAFHGHWRLVEFLLESGANPDAALDETGETPLHLAAGRSGMASELVVRVLLSAGADPRRVTRPGAPTGSFMRDCRTRGETPLHRAAAHGTEETIRLLLGAGAPPDARDANGDTPLAWGSWHGRPDGVLRLLCFDGFTISPDRRPMAESLLGRPTPKTP